MLFALTKEISRKNKTLKKEDGRMNLISRKKNLLCQKKAQMTCGHCAFLCTFAT